jgi:hypothetical protein
MSSSCLNPKSTRADFTSICVRRSVRGPMLVWQGRGFETPLARCLQAKEIFMFRQNKTRVLVEKIDDAIEKAEDLDLAFVAGILMMARLEAVQTEQLAALGRENKQLS